MRHILTTAFSILALSMTLHAADTSQPQPPQPPKSTDVPQTTQTRCLQLVYNRYITRGFSVNTSWNNAVRDCAAGIDLSCIETAYKHYVSLGQGDNQAYNNAMRDCRALIPR